MDVSLTASVLDFFVLRLGLGELELCEASDGEPLTGMCTSLLVVRLAPPPVSEAPGVGGEPNWYGLVVYCRRPTSAWLLGCYRQHAYVGVTRHQPWITI